MVKHANPTRDFNNIVLRMKAVNPDIVIPANYYNEYALLVRTMQQQKVTPKAIYSGARRRRIELQVPEGIPGCRQRHHRLQPLVQPADKRKAAELRKRVEAKGLFFTYEVFNTYTAVRLLADAIERAKSADRAAIIAALEASTFSDHFMPYGATKFVNGQNTGRAAADDAGAEGRHQGHRAARVPRGRADVPAENGDPAPDGPLRAGVISRMVAVTRTLPAVTARSSHQARGSAKVPGVTSAPASAPTDLPASA